MIRAVEWVQELLPGLGAVQCRFSPADGQLCPHPAANPASPVPLCDCHLSAAVDDLYFAQYQRLGSDPCGL